MKNQYVLYGRQSKRANNQKITIGAESILTESKFDNNAIEDEPTNLVVNRSSGGFQFESENIQNINVNETLEIVSPSPTL